MFINIFHKSIPLILILFLSGCGDNSNYFTGIVENDLIYISCEQSGQLISLTKNIGESVKVDSLLFKIDDYPENINLTKSKHIKNKYHHIVKDNEKGAIPIELKIFENQYKQKQAVLELAKYKFDNAIDLFKAGSINEDEYQRLETSYFINRLEEKQAKLKLLMAKLGKRENQLKASKEQLFAAKKDIDEKRWKIQQKTVLAPKNGIIFDIYYNVGENVPAFRPVLSILSEEDTYFKFYLPSHKLKLIKAGRQIKIKHLNDSKTYLATIYYISSKPEYTPPMVFTEDQQESLVYQVRAKPNGKLNIPIGQPIKIKMNDD